MKKILMATNGMQIGGAETHILELSIELRRMGYDITVISKGGVYAQVLERNGIRHVNAPLDSKNIISMIKSYFILGKTIKNGNFDIVHAHARIPAFLCGLLKRSLDFRFITTAHWVFNVTRLLKIMTNWGERTIAVSEDIKKYLMDNYRVSPDKITVTINGIDTQKFSPSVDASSLEKGLGLEKGKKRIVYVSRMDPDRSAVAFQLLEVLEKMDDPDLQAIIVGGGDDLQRLKKKVEQLNRKLCRTAAIATGARVDINKCVALGDIFIGVSRAALEAMAAGKPVIIAGNEGYIGIFNESTYPIALETNFCCRGCEKSTPELLMRDIQILLDSDLHKIGSYNRRMILDNYSVKRMTNDCIYAYNLLLEQPNKGIIISGYYGYSNSGDDAVLSVIINYLKSLAPNIPITILSKTPRETREAFNVKSINRFNFFGIYRSMKKSGLLISGGGSLFQDVTSTQSLIYYITIIKLALFCGLRVMVYANGIGPIRSEKNKIRTKKVLEKVDLISLRDNSSMQELKLLGIDSDKALVTADPAFALEAADQKRISEIYEQEGLEFSKKYAAVSVREWKDNCEDFEKIITKVCRHLIDKHSITPLFIPMQQNKDSAICKRIVNAIGNHARILGGNYKVDELLGIIGNMEMVIGMRLHTIIYALNRKVPVIGLSYDPKVDAVLDYANTGFRADVSDLDEAALIKAVDNIILNRDEISLKLSKTIEKLKEKTKIDAKNAINLIKK